MKPFSGSVIGSLGVLYIYLYMKTIQINHSWIGKIHLLFSHGRMVWGYWIPRGCCLAHLFHLLDPRREQLHGCGLAPWRWRKVIKEVISPRVFFSWGNQLIVGLGWWFGIPGVHPRISIPFSFGDSRNPNHPAPNQQITISWGHVECGKSSFKFLMT